MSLDTWDASDRLYLARGAEVSVSRPYFTGDVLNSIAIPGVQTEGAAMIVAHPCSMRGREARLRNQILVAAVAPHDAVPPQRWTDGFYDRMPLPELRGPGTAFECGWLDQLGRADRVEIQTSERIACASPVGVNMLQQRLVFHLTRVEVPTSTFWDAFAHTFEEADLLEEWADELGERLGLDAAAAEFEAWIRGESRQQRLRDPQQRAPIRIELRVELRRRSEKE